MDLPSVLADRLAARELDLALIPSIEYFRGESYRILPGFAIASRGPVRSVKLFARKPFHQIKRLALDEGSRTSQALARIYLAEVHGVRPAQIEQLPMGVPLQESTADAVLLIGDRCMRVPDKPFRAVVDLAEAWHQLTGLPFVFALWVTRENVDLGSLPEALDQCRAEGLTNASRVAEELAPRLGVDPAYCVDYLTRVISYDLGEPEIEGLKRFAQRAAALGLAPEGVDLVFYRRPHLATRR
jgi:chorismate dehydratase